MTPMSVSAKLRLSSVSGQKGSIYIQFIKERITKTVTTPYRVYPEEWNSRLSVVRLGNFSPKRESELREIVISLEKDLESLRLKIRKKELSGGCTLNDAAALYQTKCPTFLFSEFVDNLSIEMLATKQFRLAEAYRSASNNLIAFNRGLDIPLEAIDTELMQSYEIYMKSKGNGPNTISFYNRNTRAIYNKAIRRGLVEKKIDDPFADVFKGLAKTGKRAVRQEVIDELKGLDLEKKIIKKGIRKRGVRKRGVNKKKMNRINDMAHFINTLEVRRNTPIQMIGSLKFARDMFLLCFYLRGISFIDLAYLKKSNLVGDVIVYKRHKTGQRMEIAVTSSIKEIISKYAGYCKNSEYLFPILLKSKATRKDYLNALKRQNRRLKSLSVLVGLEVPLTTYVSRHSWASIARAKGFSISVICQGLGHESERTTQIYLDSFDYSILHEANRKITEMSNNPL